jgi:hypothetical protein
MDLKKLYGTATSLGGVGAETAGNGNASGDKPNGLEYFWLVFKDGRKKSYPYRYVGLIETDDADGHLVVHCNCEALRFINIHGEGLTLLLDGLSAHTVEKVVETKRPDYIRTGELVVVKIELVRKERRLSLVNEK